MTTKQLAEFHQTRPFNPFIINMADGKSYVVDHPEVLGYVPGARIAAHWVREAEAWRQLDLLLMTSLELYVEHTKRKRRRAS